MYLHAMSVPPLILYQNDRIFMSDSNTIHHWQEGGREGGKGGKGVSDSDNTSCSISTWP